MVKKLKAVILCSPTTAMLVQGLAIGGRGQSCRSQSNQSRVCFKADRLWNSSLLFRREQINFQSDVSPETEPVFHIHGRPRSTRVRRSPWCPVMAAPAGSTGHRRCDRQSRPRRAALVFVCKHGRYSVAAPAAVHSVEYCA